MTREELAERAIQKLAEQMEGRQVERVDPEKTPMRKFACLGSVPIAQFVLQENIIYWAPIFDGAEEGNP